MWHDGAHRYVWVIWRLVLKFPKVQIIEFLGLALKDVRSCERFWMRWFFIKDLMFGGILENWREAKCYFKTKHRLLAHLYLPFIIVNIYRRENGVGNFTFKGDELFFKVGNSEDKEFLKALRPCSHTFDHRENFSCNSKEVRIIDYGEEGFENLLIKYGDEIEKWLFSVTKEVK